MIKILLNMFYRYYFFFKKKNINLEGKIIIKGKPIIHIFKNANLVIGNNVTLNSLNSKYHANMFAPIKIYIDRPGAKIVIGENTRIHGTCLHAYDSIHIGQNCLIAANCQIFDGNGHTTYISDPSKRINISGFSKPIKIGNNCWIGLSSIILPGTVLGNNCVVAAGSIVRGVFKDNSLIGGNPARYIKSIE